MIKNDFLGNGRIDQSKVAQILFGEDAFYPKEEKKTLKAGTYNKMECTSMLSESLMSNTKKIEVKMV